MPPLISFFVIDPPERLDPSTDTSLALMQESVIRGHEVFFCTLAGLRLEGGRPKARAHPVSFPEGATPFSAGAEHDLDLDSVQVLYMRKDPPVDLAYLHATYILDRLPPAVIQVNPARCLQRNCEKLIPLHFPGLLPETVVTSTAGDLDDFLEKMGRIVLKPLGDCSGRGILALSRLDPRRRELIEQATEGGQRYVQGQRFLLEIAGGDKRVLLLGGEILGWLKRVPGAGDFRSNVNAGGRCLSCELTEAERATCNRIGLWLRKEGIHLAGIDLVGDHVLEVNITSPSCLREMNELSGERLERRIVDYVEHLCLKEPVTT